MKLSHLINYRNQLRQLDLSATRQNLHMDLSRIMHTVTSQSFNIDHDATLLSQKQQQIYENFEDFQHTCNKICHDIDQLIYEIEKPYFAESYRLYETMFGNESFEDIAGRMPALPESTVNFYRARVRRYVGWQHPAMIIRPGTEPYIHDMVSCDPLYLVDVKFEFLHPVLTLYNEVYNNRLRTYTLHEQQNGMLLAKIPNNQMGLIMAYNFFNFRPFEVIRRYLEEILQKLRPGGTLLMTFNDCDRDKAVMLVENQYCCYTPGYLIKQMAETLGFEIHFSWHDEGPSTWLELRKPGEMVSLRGGQALAKIIPK